MSEQTPPQPPPPPSAKRRGLGRGLDALLSSSAPAPATPRSATATRPQPDPESGLIEVSIRKVAPNPEQPRRTFDEAGLQTLATSIRTHGLLHPIVVERSEEPGKYRLVAGERRLLAAERAGLSTIPAILRPATESGRHALELALVENLQRIELSPMEEAAAYARLADTFGLSHEAIAMRMGRSRSAVSNTVRLLSLHAAVQEMVAEGRLSAGHARALLPLPVEHQEQLARVIDAEGLSVRRVEQLVQQTLQPGIPARMEGRSPAPLSIDDGALQRGLEEALGTPVALQRRRRGGGRLIIDFYSDEELDALYSRLGGAEL